MRADPNVALMQPITNKSGGKSQVQAQSLPLRDTSAGCLMFSWKAAVQPRILATLGPAMLVTALLWMGSARWSARFSRGPLPVTRP